MKNKIIIILISTAILLISFAIYNFTVTNYEYKNQLQKSIESLENINARIDKHISDSSNYIYYNLDFMKNEFIKMDDFFRKFSQEKIVQNNSKIEKQLKALALLFKEKDFLNYKYQKTNTILKNSTIYLATLLSKSQTLFSQSDYLALMNRTISNIYLAKAANDKEFLRHLNKSISVLKRYQFNTKAKQEFNNMLIAHLNVYNTQYKKYDLYMTKLSDDIYSKKIERFKDLVYRTMDKKLSLINIYLWVFVFLFLLASVIISYLINRIKQQEINMLIQSKNAQLGDMIGNIAHQWRQPLSTISMAATGIQVKKEIKNISLEEENKMLDTINQNAQFLSKTIDTFRNYIQEKKELKIVVLQDRINMAINIVTASLKDNNIKLINNTHNLEPIKIELIVGELSQVIINLLNNAKDIIKEKKVNNGWIKVDLVKADNNAVIIIEDNGGGIPLEIMDKIFDPYFTTKHQSVGTGLGLHMSKDIIEKSLKGKLAVRNSENGARFTITLPINNKK